jgi:two-component system chemotaxis response regulator CheY
MSIRILAVDDSPTMRGLIGAALTPNGFDVRFAEDGIDGLERLPEADPDLVITDINMPRLDGFGVIEGVRKDPTYGSLPVLVLTTESGEELKSRARQAGATGWIVKPFDDDGSWRSSTACWGSDMSGLDELRISFFQECEDLLESLGEGLRAMSDLAAAGAADGDIETVHAVFRAVHSIKGGAGAFGLDDLVTFAHLFETVLDEMRSGKMDVAEDVMHVLLRAGDMLSDLVACARDGLPPDGERVGQLLAELDALADGGGRRKRAPFEFVPTVAFRPIDFDAAGDPASRRTGRADRTGPPIHLEIGFAPAGELYGTGNEPLALLRALEQFGELTVACDDAAVAPLADFDPAAAPPALDPDARVTASARGHRSDLRVRGRCVRT